MGWERRAEYYLLEIRSLLPFLCILPGIVVTKDGLTFRIISMVAHFHQEEGHKQDKQESESPPPSPTAQVFLPFQIAHLFLERRFRNLIGVRVGKNDEYGIPQQPTVPRHSAKGAFKH